MLRELSGKQTREEIKGLSPHHNKLHHVAMVTEQPVPSPIQSMSHVNILSDSHLIHSGQDQEDL